ncbi:hypothetical protein V5799_007672 [Amblyomma americanum]|uniref:Uncharacterized protein n=1 Tax=Amblyomma americanum TaxID=6943 RepID=A0AAQ4FGQ9_AMBAM
MCRVRDSRHCEQDFVFMAAASTAAPLEAAPYGYRREFSDHHDDVMKFGAASKNALISSKFRGMMIAKKASLQVIGAGRLLDTYRERRRRLSRRNLRMREECAVSHPGSDGTQDLPWRRGHPHQPSSS